MPGTQICFALGGFWRLTAAAAVDYWTLCVIYENFRKSNDEHMSYKFVGASL